MGTVFKKTFTKPLPAGATVVVRQGKRFAEWKVGTAARAAPDHHRGHAGTWARG
jgi:hypothetical protein